MDILHLSNCLLYYWLIIYYNTFFLSEYSVIDKIGEGSFSEVLKCKHKETGVFYAAKRLKKNYKT